MTVEIGVYGEGLNSNSLVGRTAAGALESSKLYLPVGQTLRDITRLVVLVPDIDLRSDWVEPLLNRLNISGDIDIALVRLNNPASNSRAEHRRLNRLAHQLRADNHAVYRQLVNRDSWASALQSLVRSHDLLVCFPEQQVADGFHNRQPLSQAMMRALNLPVIEGPGAYPSAVMRLCAMAKRMMFQAFPFVVVALFFWLQTQIGQQADGLAYQISLGATVLVEIGLIFVWSLFLD